MAGGEFDEFPVIALVGPTAVGKSALALKLAEHYPTSVVTADSRQVYRYMDIGTAKPTLAERAAVPHYLLDLIEPVERYSAKRYREEGTHVLGRIWKQSRLPLVVGGTGFYVRALLDGLMIPEVAPDPVFREQLREEAELRGSESLHSRLAAQDPASAARIHPRNLPRLIRALEIVEKSGAPVPVQQVTSQVPTLYLGLTMERQALHRKAAARVRMQIQAGLLEETDLLLEMGYEPSSPALLGFGYRQMVACLRGETDLEGAIDSYIADTNAYIRRQLTWFRADKRVVWIDAEGQALEKALTAIRSALPHLEPA